MLLHLTHIWLAGDKLAFFLLQAAKGKPSATEDYSLWGTTQKLQWPVLAVAIVIGLIAGAIAHMLMPGRDSVGIIMTIVVGLAAAFVGGFIASLIWQHDAGTFRPAILLAVLGAIGLLVSVE